MLILLDAQWYRTKPATARRNITLHNPTPAWHMHTHTCRIKTKTWRSHAVQSAMSRTLPKTLSKNKHKARSTRSNMFPNMWTGRTQKHTHISTRGDKLPTERKSVELHWSRTVHFTPVLLASPPHVLSLYTPTHPPSLPLLELAGGG